MASPRSLYSGSPESKSTLDTPETGPYDGYFNLNTPSLLRLSPGDDFYAEWKALPSRLLESPSPIPPNIQFHAHESSHGKSTQHNLPRDCTFDLVGTQGIQHCSNENSVECFTAVTNKSSPNSELSRYYLENTDSESQIHSSQVLSDMCLTSNKYQSDWNMDQNELSAASTRHLKICNIAPATSLVILYGTLQEFGDIQEFYTQKLHPDGFCVVSYFDIRDSMTAYRKLQAEHPLSIQFCPSGYVTMLVIGSNISGRGADRQSDIMCIVTSGGCSSNVPRILYYVLSDFGSISKFTVLENSSPPAFLVTFFDTHDAFDIIDTLDGQYVEGFRLKLSFYDPDILTWNPGCSALRTRTDENGRVHIVSSQDTDVGVYTPQPSHPSIDFTCRRDSGSSVDGRYGADREGEKYLEAVYSGGYVTPKRSGLTSLNLKPSYRRTPDNFRTDSGQFQDLFSYLPSNKSHVSNIKIKDPTLSASPTCSYPLFDNRMSPKSNERLHSQAQVPGKNVIDLERIARGLDTRTTVMLRNIPNKVDQQTLKDYVDTTSKGLYNFLYLRIDFRNICNVGYAFINFIDPLDIIDFVKEKSGTRWNKFNSEKVLDVTYANIQGIDQLVEKFRNSSVMDQDPSYRPKLFHSSGPLTGTEKEFPPANNILKKCRSISAAQQIGLFAPKMSTNGKGIWRKRD